VAFEMYEGDLPPVPPGLYGLRLSGRTAQWAFWRRPAQEERWRLQFWPAPKPFGPRRPRQSRVPMPRAETAALRAWEAGRPAAGSRATNAWVQRQRKQARSARFAIVRERALGAVLAYGPVSPDDLDLVRERSAPATTRTARYARGPSIQPRAGSPARGPTNSGPDVPSWTPTRSCAQRRFSTCGATSPTIRRCGRG
jgi:hypothetical protein